LGFDHYLKGGNNEVAIEQYRIDFERNLQIVASYAQKSGKLPVIGETGMEGIPAPAYFTEILYPIMDKYAVAWVLFWRNAWEPDKPHHHYLPYPGHPAEPDFIKFVQIRKILTNKDIILTN
jgi:mannan endo-1,4-beta-mannosidase